MSDDDVLITTHRSHSPFLAALNAEIAKRQEVEAIARDLCDSPDETTQNYHRARLGHLVAGWPKPKGAA